MGRPGAAAGGPSQAKTAVTRANRSVSVPVLSKATRFARASLSRASPLRMRMPRDEARPLPTIIATGVARPIAHGQATNSRAMALKTAVPKLPSTSHHPRKVATAPARITGTNTELTRSAIFCSGALSRWARSTSCCRRLSTDSAATELTCTTRAVLPFRVPPVTTLCGPRSTGSGSPVSIDSSTEDQPRRTVPSRGIVSPGRTRMTAPAGTVSGGTSSPLSSSGSDTRRAVGGRSSSSECIAREAR